MTEREQVKRNKQITEKWVSGLLLRELAALFNMSITRVYEIILSNRNYMELERQRNKTMLEFKMNNREICPICGERFGEVGKTKYCSIKCAKTAKKLTYEDGGLDKYETARYMRSVGYKWSQIAKILNYASSASCQFCLRKYAENHDRLWPLPHA